MREKIGTGQAWAYGAGLGRRGQFARIFFSGIKTQVPLCLLSMSWAVRTVICNCKNLHVALKEYCVSRQQNINYFVNVGIFGPLYSSGNSSSVSDPKIQPGVWGVLCKLPSGVPWRSPGCNAFWSLNASVATF